MTTTCAQCSKRARHCRKLDSKWFCDTCVGLVTCPLCGRDGFSVRGLRAHHCRSTADRRRLTPDELDSSVQAHFRLARRIGGAK